MRGFGALKAKLRHRGGMKPARPSRYAQAGKSDRVMPAGSQAPKVGPYGRIR